MTTTSEIKEVNDIYFLAGTFHHLWQVDTFLAGEINFKDDCHQVSLSLYSEVIPPIRVDLIAHLLKQRLSLVLTRSIKSRAITPR